jgi:hypothetical protein
MLFFVKRLKMVSSPGSPTTTSKLPSDLNISKVNEFSSTTLVPSRILRVAL